MFWCCFPKGKKKGKEVNVIPVDLVTVLSEEEEPGGQEDEGPGRQDSFLSRVFWCCFPKGKKKGKEVNVIPLDLVTVLSEEEEPGGQEDEGPGCQDSFLSRVFWCCFPTGVAVCSLSWESPLWKYACN